MLRSGRIKSPVNYALAISTPQAHGRLAGAGMMPDGAGTFDNTSKSPAQAYLPARLRIPPSVNSRGAITGAPNVGSREYEGKNTKVMIRQANRGLRG